MKNNRRSPANAAGRSRELREVTGTRGLQRALEEPSRPRHPGLLPPAALPSALCLLDLSGFLGVGGGWGDRAAAGLYSVPSPEENLCCWLLGWESAARRTIKVITCQGEIKRRILLFSFFFPPG